MPSNEELVAEIQRGNDRQDNLAALYEKNKGLVHAVALPLVRPGVEIDDLCQEAYFALLKAAEQYDDKQGGFANYAGLWVRWWLVRYIQNNCNPVRIPTGQQERIRQYKRCCSDFERDFGRLPTSEELSSIMGISPMQLENVRRDAMLLSMGSLEAPVEGMEEDCPLVEVLPDPENGVEDLVEDIQQEELALLLWSIVDSLREDRAFVLRKRYQEGETLASCAAMMGKSTERARQIEREAFRQIRHSRKGEELKSFLDDQREALAYHHNGLNSFRSTGISGPEWAAFKLMGGKSTK